MRSPNNRITEDLLAMERIAQKKRYLPHEMSTNINSVKLYVPADKRVGHFRFFGGFFFLTVPIKKHLPCWESNSKWM